MPAVFPYRSLIGKWPPAGAHRIPAIGRGYPWHESGPGGLGYPWALFRALLRLDELQPGRPCYPAAVTKSQYLAGSTEP